MTKGLVSVVIPSYNHGRFIGRALEHLKAQTYEKWEAIVVDNYSDDGTDSVLEHQASPKIRVVKIRNGGIIAKSRNRGISEARGEWIAFLDSDDWWTPDKLRSCLTDADHIDLVYHRLRAVREDQVTSRRAIMPSRSLRAPAWKDLVLRGNPIANSSVLVRASVMQSIGGLREERALVAAEDFNAWIRIARSTARLRYVRDVLGSYLEHDGASSLRDMSAAYAAATAEFIDLLSPAERRRVAARIAYIAGRYQFLSGSLDGIATTFAGVLRHGDLDLKAKALYMMARAHARRS